jgi:hypothetical protein
MAYDNVDPIGDQRLDYMGALIASTIANTTRSKPSDRLFTALDFMPPWSRSDQPAQPEKSSAEMLAHVVRGMARMGAVPERLQHLIPEDSQGA